MPKKVFAVMGTLDALSGIMQIFASTYLGGSLIILLTQARFSRLPVPVVPSRDQERPRLALSPWVYLLWIPSQAKT